MPLPPKLQPAGAKAWNLLQKKPQLPWEKVLVALVGVSALFTFLCLIGFTAGFVGVCHIIAPPGSLCDNDYGDTTVGDHAFGGSDSESGQTWEGAGGAIFAFVCQLFLILLVLVTVFFVLPTTPSFLPPKARAFLHGRQYARGFYCLLGSSLLVLLSFTYFASDTQTYYSGRVTITTTPGVTWGWVFNILAVFTYLPAAVLALGLASKDDSDTHTPEPAAAGGAA